jgi:predicted methyltransferase
MTTSFYKTLPALALGAALTTVLGACQQSDQSAESMGGAEDASQSAETAVQDPAAPAPAPAALAAGLAGNGLAAVLSMQAAELQARYGDRHPQQTLEFFGVEPGMNVLEALPAGGWYSKILIQYLGLDGTLVGADYALDMYRKLGSYNEEQLAAKASWSTDWVAKASVWLSAGGADVEGFNFGAMPERVAGEVDAVLFIRALHNLARLEHDGGYLSAALADANSALKPGGIVGVVQHMAPESASDEWAGGANGYLKKSFVIASLEGAGFELVGESAVNENPLDQPTEDDFVWRLPPTLAISGDSPKVAESFEAIGESNRMTLLFRKPE